MTAEYFSFEWSDQSATFIQFKFRARSKDEKRLNSIMHFILCQNFLMLLHFLSLFSCRGRKLQVFNLSSDTDCLDKDFKGSVWF